MHGLHGRRAVTAAINRGIPCAHGNGRMSDAVLVYICSRPAVRTVVARQRATPVIGSGVVIGSSGVAVSSYVAGVGDVSSGDIGSGDVDSDGSSGDIGSGDVSSDGSSGDVGSVRCV